MSEETPAAEPQEEAVATPEATQPATVPVRVVEELRAKAREYEQQLTQFKQAEEERKKAELSEVERLTLELNEAKSAADQATKTAALELKRSKARVALAEQRAHNPEKVLRLLDLDNIDPDNIGEAVVSLRETDAYLFASDDNPAPSNVGSPTPSKGNASDSNGPDQDLIWLQQAGLV